MLQMRGAGEWKATLSCSSHAKHVTLDVIEFADAGPPFVPASVPYAVETVVDETPIFARLLRRSAVALAVCAALVAICYVFVDRAVATFVYEHKLSDFREFEWLTDPPPILQAWAPLVLALLMVRCAWGAPSGFERALLASCVSLILADQFRESLSYVFGRTWPETWIDNNPSFIRDGVFGFHPFQGGEAYGSFPSGHTARIVALATPFWILFRRPRPLCVLACLSVAVGLIGMNYHFVSDVIAGAFVGGIVGMYTTPCCALATK